MKKQWKFALPPSVMESGTYVAQVRTALSTIGCSDVKGSLTYGLLMDDVVGGLVDAAWAPPLLCARLEQLGGRVMLRAVRGGTSTYRSVLFARADRKLSLENLKGTQAAWMDQRSMSGFVLPRALLRRHGVSPESTFTREKFLGSYPAMVKAVLDGKVDVSSTYASAPSASAQRLGYADIAAERTAELTPLGFSPECPHDGIVLSPRITPDEAKEFAAAFERLMLDSAPAKVLCNALQVEGFDAPTPGKYAEMVSAFASEAPEGAH